MSADRNPERKSRRKRNPTGRVSPQGSGERAQELIRERALVRELAARLEHLRRDLEAVYEPALSALVRAGEPGASEVVAELEDGASGGFLEALDWLRHDLRGFVYASGDPDLFSHWYYMVSREEPAPGACARARRPPTLAEVFRDIAEETRDPVAELERFKRGQAKAAAR